MRELQPGVWHWEASHPDWNPKQDWGPVVSSYAIDDGERLLVFDPLAPPSLIDELAAGREPVIVLTCPWHERDARSLVERLGATVFVPPPDEGDPDPVEGQVFRAGERLPVGLEALPGMEPNELVLWVESRRALVVGDTLIDRGNGLEFPADWANKGVSPREILEALRPSARAAGRARASDARPQPRPRPRRPDRRLPAAGSRGAADVCSVV